MPYLISLCKDQSLATDRSKRFFIAEVGSFINLATLIAQHRIWSPIIWKDGHNKKINFEAAYYLVLDLDNGEISLEECRKQLINQHYSAIIYTTGSHQKFKNKQPPCDRFRIIIPFSKPVIDLKTYEYNLRIWIKKYFADRACGSGASAFKPALHGVEVLYGENIVEPVKLPPIAQKKSPYLNSRQIPSWLEAKLTFGSPGERHRTLFHVAATLSAFGFNESETIEIISKSPLWEQGSDDDSRRTTKDGWHKGQQS